MKASWSFAAVLSFSLLSLSLAQASAADPAELGKFRNTYYYLVIEADYASLPKDDVILDRDGGLIARVSTKFRKATDIEGSGKLEDGRVINFDGKKDGRIRYRISPNSYGDGVGTCALVPFHTVAVDRTRIPLGSLVLIEETVGMPLPDGTTHNGLWRAEDVGGAIKQDRVDLFIGERRFSPTLDAYGITHLRPLTIKMVEAPSESGCAVAIENIPPSAGQ